MTLSGVQHINIPQSGKTMIKVVPVILVLLIFLCSCTTDFSYWLVGDGRGDWTYELFGGYALSKVNSSCIVLGYNDDPDSTGHEFVLPPYFVTAFQLHEPYILLEGIPTEDSFATEEELNERKLAYYIVNSDNHEIMGPFDTLDDLENQCDAISVEIDSQWYDTQDIYGKAGEGAIRPIR